MRILIIIYLVLLGSQSISQVYVKGYYKKNGTYVAPYVRSSPNSSTYDNYSYPGNTNPYTGITATGDQISYSINTSGAKTVWVNGYYRKNGTWVNGYWRSPPNTANNTPSTSIQPTPVGQNNQPLQKEVSKSAILFTNSYSVGKTYKVNSSLFQVFIQPNVASKIIATLKLGEDVKVTEVTNSIWLRINFNFYDQQTFTNKSTLVSCQYKVVG